MKRPVWIVLALAIAAAVFAGREHVGGPGPAPASPAPSAPAVVRLPEGADDGSLARAIAGRGHEVPVTGRGEVIRILADDADDRPHQRLVLRVAGGGTVLVAHNIELAPRLAPVAIGDQLEFAGDYVWNDQGGVVHWTHPDPAGRHRAGYLRNASR